MDDIAAEVISIGNEVLSGKITNENSAFISRKLKEAGFSVARQTTIPDDHDIILETFSESMACVPLVIATGGLGPTLDDITRKAAAELFDSPLEFNAELAETMIKRFGNWPSIQDQATLPKKALILPNLLGTASGLVFYNGRSTLILLPGVPVEMEALMEREVLPYLQRTYHLLDHKKVKWLHYARVYESLFDPVLRTIQEVDPDLKIGIYPANGLVSVSLEGDESSVKLGESILEKNFGEFRYDAEDGKVESAVHAMFLQNKWTLSIAESCTGGALSACLTALPGASGYFLGSAVSYANSFKEEILGISPDLIQKKGAVSEDVAAALAESIQKKTKSTFSIGVTGIAGPTGGTEEKPVGTVYFAIKEENKPAKTFLLKIISSRALIIERTVHWALGELIAYAKNRKQND